MEILILSGILSSAFFIGSFAFGYYLGTKKQKKDAYVVKNKNDVEQLQELANWLNYKGGC
jgi:hypothetical protein